MKRRKIHDWPSKPNLKMPICPGLAAMVICNNIIGRGPSTMPRPRSNLTPMPRIIFGGVRCAFQVTILTVRSRTTRSRSASNPITGRRTIIGAGHTTTNSSSNWLCKTRITFWKNGHGMPPTCWGTYTLLEAPTSMQSMTSNAQRKPSLKPVGDIK